MVVDDFHIFRARGRPAEADAELIVDANAMLSRAVALELFKAIPWWNPQVLQLPGDLQLPKFAAGNRLDIDKSLDTLSAGKLLRVSVLEGYDHAESITRYVNNVKRDYVRIFAPAFAVQ